MANLSPAAQEKILQLLPNIVKSYQIPDFRKANLQILTSFLPFVGLWVAMYLLIDVSIWLTLLLGLVNAFFLVRIFIIQHDCGHQSFTPSRRLNDFLGLVSSTITIIPYKYWAKSHHYHHGHNGLLDDHRDVGDVNLLTVEEFSRLSRWQRFQYRLYRHWFILFVLGGCWYVFVVVRLPFIRLKGWTQAHFSLLYHNLWVTGFYVLLALLLGWKAVLLVHFPIVAFFSVIAMWFFYVQHQHDNTYKQLIAQWDYVRAAIQGSTYYKLPKIFHWLTGNIGYHHIHHLNSLIPNYELARCHQENPVFEQLITSVTFKDSLRFVFNKLWDEQEQRMISFREFYRRRQG
ncbi:MAG: fatty acid desaturase [Saprospiraceae bacterium]|nr:fatty acid desaturase [Saprospiraceae bacterium]